MVPSGARPGPPCARSVCSLSLVYRGPRLPAPSSRRDHAGQSLPTRRCAVPRRGSCLWWQVAVHGPRARHPPHPEGCRGDGGGWEGGGGSRSHPPPVSHPRAFRRVRPSPGRVHVSAFPAARACCAWCVLCALGFVRLSPRPPFLGSVSTAGGFAGALLPSSGTRRVRVSWGLTSLSGADSFGGTAVEPRPARRRTSGPAAARGSPSAGDGVGIGPLSRVGVFPGSRGVRRSRVGSAPQVWWDCSGELCAV